MRNIFVTGIGTGVGKTVVSAVLAQALGGDYWKPVQAGGLDFSDSDAVRSLISDPAGVIHPERHRLKTPCSPHAAAESEGIEIRLSDFVPPVSERPLVIEGAGGVLVPLNRGELMADLIKALGAEAVLVSEFYLGSINHTLLSVEALRARRIPLLGIIFNGERNPESEKAILEHSGARRLGHIPRLERIDREAVRALAKRFGARLQRGR